MKIQEWKELVRDWIQERAKREFIHDRFTAAKTKYEEVKLRKLAKELKRWIEDNHPWAGSYADGRRLDDVVADIQEVLVEEYGEWPSAISKACEAAILEWFSELPEESGWNWTEIYTVPPLWQSQVYDFFYGPEKDGTKSKLGRRQARKDFNEWAGRKHPEVRGYMEDLGTGHGMARMRDVLQRTEVHPAQKGRGGQEAQPPKVLAAQGEVTLREVAQEAGEGAAEVDYEVWVGGALAGTADSTGRVWMAQLIHDLGHKPRSWKDLKAYVEEGDFRVVPELTRQMLVDGIEKHLGELGWSGRKEDEEVRAGEAGVSQAKVRRRPSGAEASERKGVRKPKAASRKMEVSSGTGVRPRAMWDEGAPLEVPTEDDLVELGSPYLAEAGVRLRSKG